ncbi:MAG TPA: sigma-70 family RNA polymerase sigma factor [Streptosporangiaceae bacterium]|jgi:RNA polymerase sigma-70 factor (ECF subfamily)|nr:sigma-70 family RNA polymerase sigma factor [Streptosporangiaceae bacterium]
MALLRPGCPSARADPDAELADRLRAGDEDAFVALARKYQAVMLSVALGYVPSRAVAEEVVQDAWVGVLRGIARFEHRSTFRTWLFRIVVNRAVSTAARERRSVPVTDLDPVVIASRFDAVGAWAVPPEPWADQVEDKLTAAKMAARILAAIDELPPRQREVVTLRDVQGMSSAEVCGALGISQANQRVLLHRGRSWLRQLIESEFGRAR